MQLKTEMKSHGVECRFMNGAMAGTIRCSAKPGPRWIAEPVVGDHRAFYAMEAAEYYILAMAIEGQTAAFRVAA